MRPKIAIVIVGVGLLALLPVLVVVLQQKRHSNEHTAKVTESRTQPGAIETSRPNTEPEALWRESHPSKGSGATPASSTEPSDAAQAQHSAEVEARVAELGDLGMQDDANAFDRIVSALNDPEPEVRKAAVEATIQFGSPEAIPRLQEAASQSKDPREKTAIKEAIEMLKLPNASELLAHKRARPNSSVRPKSSPAQ